MNRFLALGALVAADLATKALAVALLPVGEPVDPDRWLQVVLRRNELGWGSWAQALDPAPTQNDILGAALSHLLLAATFLYLRRLEWALWKKIVAGIVAVSIGFGLVSLAGSGLPALPVPLQAGISRFGLAALFLVLCWLVRSRLARAVTALFAAAALGNGLCLFPPPHTVVDFLYSRAISAVFGQGVFNLADLYYDAGLIGVTVLLGRAVVSRFRRRSPSAVIGSRLGAVLAGAQDLAKMSKTTDLHEAVKGGDLAALRALLAENRGLANARSETDARGTFPLHVAAEFGRTEAARILLEHGADVTLLDHENEAIALGWAAFFGRPDVVSVLLEAGSEPSQRNKHGLTPLGCAVGGTLGKWRQFSDATLEDWGHAADALRARGAIE